MAYRLNYRATLSPAQRRVADPIHFDSEKATVVSVSKAGIFPDLRTGVDKYRLTVETSEEQGRLFTLQGQASMARPLSELKVGDQISFTGVVEGSIRNPLVVVTGFKVLGAE